MTHDIEQQSASLAHTCPGNWQFAGAHAPLLQVLSPQQSLCFAHALPLGAQPGAAQTPLVHVLEQHCALAWHG